MGESSTEPIERADDESLEYRSVEPWAIWAVLLGLVSPVSILAPVLWLVPILGVATACVALGKLRRAPERLGQTAALVGLALSLFMITMPVARAVSQRVLLVPQARPVADQFFEFLREGSPQKAMLLHQTPDFRPPIDDGLWSFYRNDRVARNELTKFVEFPAIRMLLALGERAEVRYLKTDGVGATRKMANVHCLYTVTSTGDDGKKKTIIFGILLERHSTENGKVSPWWIKDFAAGIDLTRST